MAFTNKVFFITGAAKGLGRGYMNAALERGAKVFFIDLNERQGRETRDEMAAKFGSDKVKFKAADVTDNAAFEAAFKEAVATFKQIDVMVNNAGILNEGAWELMIKINVNALVWGTKLAAEHMRKDKGGKGGRIINISSICGLVEMYFVPIYVGTKHAVRAYTASLAAQPDLDVQGIEYGILCPDPARTDLIMTVDNSKMDYGDQWCKIIKDATMPIQQVVDAFLELVQLKNMNGAMLWVQETSKTYQKVVRLDAISPDDPKAKKEVQQSNMGRWFTSA